MRRINMRRRTMVSEQGHPYHHAERLLQKLMPKTPEQTRKLEKVRDQIWALSTAI